VGVATRRSGEKGVRGKAPNAEEIFTVLFPKNAHFLAYFGRNFYLKRVLIDCKKSADAHHRPAPGDTCPHLLY